MHSFFVGNFVTILPVLFYSLMNKCVRISVSLNLFEYLLDPFELADAILFARVPFLDSSGFKASGNTVSNSHFS